MRYYCTYFDHNYLPRGLALYHSLQRHCPQSQLFVLCLTPQCHDVLTRLQLPNVRLARLEEMEAGDEPLRQARTNRSLVEYYFTCTPTFILYALKQCPEAQAITSGSWSKTPRRFCAP
ncbi:MAG: hypothetical protein NTX50_29365 [Candidatus Sumerlaeota bacterium]|nr:hypothetical protein [Candidatus Sumerlaeota bacterium]